MACQSLLWNRKRSSNARAALPGCAMCGRLRVGKGNLHVALPVGAAMCSACLCGRHDRWPDLTISPAISIWCTFRSYISCICWQVPPRRLKPIRSRSSEHFLRGLSTASTRIVVRTARPPARAASALWIDERGAQQATGFNSASARSSEGSLFRECAAPALVLVRCVPHGALHLP